MNSNRLWTHCAVATKQLPFSCKVGLTFDISCGSPLLSITRPGDPLNVNFACPIFNHKGQAQTANQIQKYQKKKSTTYTCHSDILILMLVFIPLLEITFFMSSRLAMFYVHLAVGGIDINIASVEPPVFKPNRVPLSHIKLNSTYLPLFISCCSFKVLGHTLQEKGNSRSWQNLQC